MVNEIQPNRWYNLYQVFGDNLFNIDKHHINRPELDGELEEILHLEMQQRLIATFKGGKLEPDFEHQDFSLNDLSRTESGEPIYFPVETPKLGDFEGFRTLPLQVARPKIGNYASLLFAMHGIPEEDLIGEVEVINTPLGEEKLQAYRYQFVLRTERGTFASESGASVNEEGTGTALFYYWRPISSNKIGRLYVPMEYQKIASLEIMLQQK